MAQQAPFGTDEQPSLAVKIVGSKAFEVKARNGGRYGSLSRTPYKFSTCPPWYLDDYPAEISKSNKPYLTSISSSYPPPQPKSHRDGGEKMNTDRNEVKQNVTSSDTAEAMPMDFMLSRMLFQYPSSKFKEIYTEMAGYDSRLSGYISEHQVETCLQRHKVPIPFTVLKPVLPKFCSKENATMINYESLIKYLFSFSLKSKPSHVRKLSNEINLDKLVPGPGSLHDTENTLESSYVSPRSLVKKAMDDREEAYLLVQMEQAFKANGPQIVDVLKKLKKDLSKLSNGTEYIKADQIERTCSWLHIPLHHTLLGKILNRFDFKKNGKINWREFVNFLGKAVPLSIQQNSTATSSSLPFWESQTPLAPVEVSPKKEYLEDRSRLSGSGVKVPKERKSWDTTNRNDRENANIERSYNILKVERFRNGESGGSGTTDHVDVIESRDESGDKPETTASVHNAETLDDKLERFSHLTEALLRSDVDNRGTLHVRDVLRIVSNYNLIYNLNLPGEKVQKIIESCKVEKAANEVVIEDLARSLWSLMK